MFPNTFTVASNELPMLHEDSDISKIITNFECIFLWSQVEIVKGALKKLVQQAGFSKAAGIKKSDKNEGIQ